MSWATLHGQRWQVLGYIPSWRRWHVLGYISWLHFMARGGMFWPLHTELPVVSGLKAVGRWRSGKCSSTTKIYDLHSKRLSL